MIAAEAVEPEIDNTRWQDSSSLATHAHHTRVALLKSDGEHTTSPTKERVVLVPVLALATDMQRSSIQERVGIFGEGAKGLDSETDELQTHLAGDVSINATLVSLTLLGCRATMAGSAVNVRIAQRVFFVPSTGMIELHTSVHDAAWYQSQLLLRLLI